jgi:hypothetical protein
MTDSLTATRHPTPALGPQPFVSAAMAKDNAAGRCTRHHDGTIACVRVTSEAQPVPCRAPWCSPWWSLSGLRKHGRSRCAGTCSWSTSRSSGSRRTRRSATRSRSEPAPTRGGRLSPPSRFPQQLAFRMALLCGRAGRLTTPKMAASGPGQERNASRAGDLECGGVTYGCDASCTHGHFECARPGGAGGRGREPKVPRCFCSGWWVQWPHACAAACAAPF